MIHLVYPFDETKIAAPWSIGNYLAKGLREAGHKVAQYDWMSRETIKQDPLDVLIGHPHPDPGHAFANSLGGKWAKKIALTPFNGAAQNIERIIDQCNHWAAICGEYWFDKIPEKNKEHSTRMDLAIDMADYPFVKKTWSAPGERKFAYLGCTLPVKNVRFLSMIAESMPDINFGHFGYGTISHLWPWGQVDFSTQYYRDVMANHDFILCGSCQDANSTAILEAMAWGLIPVCTEESGWTSPPAIHIPLNNVPGTLEVLSNLIQMPEEELKEIQNYNIEQVKGKYTWKVFTNKILQLL